MLEVWIRHQAKKKVHFIVIRVHLLNQNNRSTNQKSKKGKKKKTLIGVWEEMSQARRWREHQINTPQIETLKDFHFYSLASDIQDARFCVSSGSQKNRCSDDLLTYYYLRTLSFTPTVPSNTCTIIRQ